jgi:transposase
MKKVTAVGLDLAKASFQVHGADEDGRAVLKKSLRRNQLLDFFAKLPPCRVGMEACSGAHHWARKLREQGHEPLLIPPQYVKPYVKTNKTDAADAEAICEAMLRPGMRFVTVKNEEQQAILSVHRARQIFIHSRTATGNHIRGLLAEYGIVLPQGIHNLARVREALIGHELPGVFREVIELQLHHLREIQDRIEELERQIERWARDNDPVKRLMAVPGVGIMIATALVATVGDARQFRNSRDLAVWLGLTPRQHSTGGKARLLGISKRGDVYLRTLMIHGARSVLAHVARTPGGEQTWHYQVMRRRHKNIAAVALAHKNARTMWALLAREEKYDPRRRAPLVECA